MSHNKNIIENPRISVCIPVYNGEKYITETIESVLMQNYSNIEIIVQDNASTDNTWDVLMELSGKFPELFIVKNDINVGMVSNWNRAINHSTGDYIMLLSADDYLNKGYISKCLSVFQNNEVDVVTTNHYYLKDGFIKKRNIKISSRIYVNFCSEVLLYNPFSINFTLFSKKAINQLIIDGNLFKKFITCDYDLWIRQALSGIRVYYVDEPLATYRLHESNLSKQVKRMSRQTTMVVLNYRQEFKTKCWFSYRFTLLRFLFRSVKNIFTNKMYDKRLIKILYREMLR